MRTLFSFVFLLFFILPANRVLAGPINGTDKDRLAGKIDSILSNRANFHENDQKLNYYYKIQEAFKLAFELADSLRISNCYQTLGQYFIVLGNFTEAFENYNKAIQISDRIKDFDGVSESFFQMGIISYGIADYNEAIRFFNKALPFFNTPVKVRRYNTTLYLIGLCFTESSQFDKATQSLNQALINFEAACDSVRICETKTGILQLLVRQNKMAEAEQLYNSLVSLNSEYVSRVRMWIELEMGYLYRQNKMDNRALSHALTSEDVASGESVNSKYKYNLYTLLSNLYEDGGVYKDALFYYKRAAANLDSMNSADMSKKLEGLKSSLEIKQKQSEIDLLNSQVRIGELAKRISYLVIFSLVGFLIFLAFFIRTRNKLANQLKLKNERLGVAIKKSDDLLLNILPEEVAEELKEKGHSQARLFSDVTVMFTDFVNFTGLSESLQPERLVEELDYCFKEFDIIMDKYNVEKIKTIGDAYMAASGLPIADSLHCNKAIKAAQDIVTFMAGYIEKRKSEGLPFLEIRIGLHSGPVVAGIVGVRKFAYDIWGDTVNTAARMEQNSLPGKINVSGATYELAKNEFSFEYRGKLPAKNKGEVDMYFVK